MTVYIYDYDENTKEYLGFREADADPEETKIQGKFIPLVPANAVLTAPPEYGENEIAVYNPPSALRASSPLEGAEVSGEWVIQPDYRKNFYKSDYYLNISDIDTIGEQEGFILVDKETGEDVKAHRENYKIVNDEIVKKSDEEIAAEELERAKQAKIFENDTVREAAINSGVTYKGILFDSDTEQKANIIGSVLTMSETDVITWFGMNNDAMECTKEDLENIGALIAQLHSFCWTRNAEIKHEIALAETIEEVNAIIIDYSAPFQGEVREAERGIEWL